MSRGTPLNWAQEAEADERLLRSLPRRPGERTARDVDVSGVGALRFSSAFEKTLQQAAKSKPGGGGKQRAQQSWGQDMTQVYCCAACRVDSSGEVSFAQHCQGKSHRKQAGRSGFVGLVPNAAGIEPRVSEALIASCAGAANSAPPAKGKGAQKGKAEAPAAAAAKGAAQRGEPGVVSVGFSAVAHANMRSALNRSASETELATAAFGGYGDSGRQQPRGGGGRGSAPAPRARPGGRPLPAPLPASGAAAPAPQAAASERAPPVEVFRRTSNSPAVMPPSYGRFGEGSSRLPPLPPQAPAPQTDSADRAAMQRQRDALPAALYNDAICEAVARNQVVIVEGARYCCLTPLGALVR